MQAGIARAEAIVAAFFELVRKTENAVEYLTGFPRNIETLILYGLEIPIEYRAELTTSTASHYLCKLRGIPDIPRTGQEDRPLYGLLHVGPPLNIIFIKESLSPRLRNYVLAHELGHFLADIYFVRNLWLKSLPEQAENVLRAFSWQTFDARLELQALLRGLPPRPQPILERGTHEHPQTVEREITADLIGREMLAPWKLVAPLYQRMEKDRLISALRKEYGLPLRVAIDYYDDLRKHFAPHPDVITRLFGRYLDSGEAPQPKSK